MNELMPVGPVSPLRQRLIDDMTMRRFSHETQRNYLRDVRRFATWLGRSPHTATAEDIRVIQALLGHAKLNTTAFYTQVATKTMRAVTSPLDRLALTTTRGAEPDG